MSKNSKQDTNLPKYKENSTLIDDPIIPSQQYVCVSFITPSKILKRREMYLFEQFVKQWDFTKSVEKMIEFLQFVSYKYKVNVENILTDFTEFAEDQKELLHSTPIDNDYKNFLDKNEERLNAKFDSENSFQTSVQGIKIRGSYSTYEEASERGKWLRQNVEPNHDIAVGKVGCWMPWDPDAYRIGKIDFLQDDLNKLYDEKLKNEASAKQEFEQRIKDTKMKAIEENMKIAKESGNKLSQTINESGDLVGITDTVDFESREAAETNTAPVLKEMYETIQSRGDEKQKEE